MILIIGGAYQGKLEYAKEAYRVGDNDLFTCSEDKAAIDLGKKAICHLELFISALLKSGRNPLSYFRENLHLLKDKIIICDDISCGVVSIDPFIRNWREEVGRSLIFLAQNSDSVIRVFCGIGTKLK